MNKHRLKQWCDGNSLEYLAYKCEITAGYLHMIIRGDRSPSKRLAKKIERVTKGRIPWESWDSGVAE